ncbi:RluA family pseudouridine synthase [Salinibacter altiplanensis]|uniref:RluA family pseudouridine synthase n=1 Tax=Salinibacter altiplanensis TaxID=1803181 RepID=UPI001E583B05
MGLVTILYRDECLLVVNKPPGLLSQPDHSGAPDVVSRGKEMLSDGTGEAPFLGLVHRLDRPASGVMALARSSEAARHLSRQFRERVVEKRYVVVVEGTLNGIGSWVDYIAKSDRRARLVDADHPEGKRAELDWQVLESNSARTLLQVTLQTGRSHQIRLQAASRGHPVVGDDRYGASASLTDRAIALHHVLLRADHPARPRRKTIRAPLPACWSDVLTDAMDAAIHRMLDREQPS